MPKVILNYARDAKRITGTDSEGRKLDYDLETWFAGRTDADILDEYRGLQIQLQTMIGAGSLLAAAAASQPEDYSNDTRGAKRPYPEDQIRAVALMLSIIKGRLGIQGEDPAPHVHRCFIC